MNETEQYCIYTDKPVAPENGNMDHIIPLSLGGANEFVVWSDCAYNSRLGSKVDAKMLQDIALPFALRNAGVKGHSKKPIIPQWKKVVMEDRPMQVTFGLDEIKAWDAKSHRTLPQEELKGKPFEATFKLDTDMNYRFIAKVCLAGGYFLYGDTFKELSECQTLRQLMEFDRKTSTPDDYKASTTRFCDRFHPDAKEGGNAYFERVLCETVGRSILISEPHQKGIAMHLGLTEGFWFIVVTERNEDETKPKTSKIEADKTVRPNQLWQTDFTYLKVIGWGWFYLSTILDDYSRYIVAWKLCTGMKAEDVTATLELALEASGCDQVDVVHKPRLLSDNGSSYISGDLADWLEDQGMSHTRGAPNHPQTQGKIERWHQTLKNRILLENYYLPGDLENQINAFVDHYNNERYHESLVLQYHP
ncbi:MAG: DDE-type integrase/transposase/recombinase [Methylocystaceae bacterium]|nr:DDE-type integrase/transposase/recombinase [Methylocystaceae bacterium]